MWLPEGGDARGHSLARRRGYQRGRKVEGGRRSYLKRRSTIVWTWGRGGEPAWGGGLEEGGRWKVEGPTRYSSFFARRIGCSCLVPSSFLGARKKGPRRVDVRAYPIARAAPGTARAKPHMHTLQSASRAHAPRTFRAAPRSTTRRHRRAFPGGTTSAPTRDPRGAAATCLWLEVKCMVSKASCNRSHLVLSRLRTIPRNAPGETARWDR